MAEHNGGALLEARKVGRTYDTGPDPVEAISDVSLSVEPGTFLVVKGRSGSGKTTLLNMLGGLDEPTTGSVHIAGLNLAEMDETELAETRRTRIGFIFQAFGLIPILTATENVEVPMRMVRMDPAERRSRSQELLEMVGLGDRTGHRPEELSGGEQQRVAIARALANRPGVLIADEPTGQLDSRTGRTIVELISRLVQEAQLAAVVATHDPAPLAVADRVVELRDGRVLVGPYSQRASL